MGPERIVADGHDRLLADPENQKRVDHAVQEVRAKYAKESQGLGRLARARRWLQMRREIRVAVQQMAPRGACYIGGVQ